MRGVLVEAVHDLLARELRRASGCPPGRAHVPPAAAPVVPLPERYGAPAQPTPPLLFAVLAHPGATGTAPHADRLAAFICVACARFPDEGRGRPEQATEGDTSSWRQADSDAVLRVHAYHPGISLRDECAPVCPSRQVVVLRPGVPARVSLLHPHQIQ